MQSRVSCNKCRTLGEPQTILDLEDFDFFVFEGDSTLCMVLPREDDNEDVYRNYLPLESSTVMLCTQAESKLVQLCDVSISYKARS